MGSETESIDLERLADYFIGYLFDEYEGTAHVRRVATWIGFLLSAIGDVADELSRNRSRQIIFTYRDHKFKARYDHQIGGRGGIEIVEVLPGRGQPDGDTVIEVANLEEAEEFYHSLRDILNNFIR